MPLDKDLIKGANMYGRHNDSELMPFDGLLFQSDIKIDDKYHLAKQHFDVKIYNINGDTIDNIDRIVACEILVRKVTQRLTTYAYHMPPFSEYDLADEALTLLAPESLAQEQLILNFLGKIVMNKALSSL